MLHAAHNLPSQPLPVAAHGPDVPLSAVARRVLVVPAAAGATKQILGLLRLLNTPWLICPDGRAVIEAARKEPVCCVLAPMDLPDLSLTEMLAALQPVAPGIAVIVIAEDADVPRTVAMMQAGAHAVIEARALPVRLMAQLRTLIERN